MPAEALDIADGMVARGDREGGAEIALGEIARRLAPGSPVLAGSAPGLSAEGWHRSDLMAYPYGVHIAQLSVDAGTGGVAVERYLIAYDVGRAVNPMLVDGQLMGGCVQGLGGALFEEFRYDAAGAPLSVTFADYLMPTLAETPPIDLLVCEDAPSPYNGLGVKGAGEGGINPVGAAIASAIDAAIGIPGAIDRLPVTPERLRAIFEGGGEGVGADTAISAEATCDVRLSSWSFATVADKRGVGSAVRTTPAVAYRRPRLPEGRR